jgi:hypothetical protein
VSWGISTYFPRFDFMSSQGISAVLQFLHGCSSITLHRTRRELQALQAFFARDRGRPLAVCVELLDMLLVSQGAPRHRLGILASMETLESADMSCSEGNGGRW